MPKNFVAILQGFLLGCFLMLICTLIGAAALIFTPVSEGLVLHIVPYVRFGCVFCGAIAAAAFNGHQGLWQGLGVSVVFIVFFLLCRILFNLQEMNIFVCGITFCLAGALGGIVGVIAK